jgi:hypothetical protein
MPTKIQATIEDLYQVRENGKAENAEQEMTAKRRDYFAASTQVVWDVDVLRSEAVTVFGATGPDNPRVYHRDAVAEAEPAVPGWTMPVRDLFG